MTVREGWVVFDRDGEPVIRPREVVDQAWTDATNLLYDTYKDELENEGYACRCVRVTIETIEDKGESE